MDGAPPDAPVRTSTEATPHDVLVLAAKYAEAADCLFAEHRRSQSDLNLPARLCALHAVELYLHAFLRYRGASAKQLRTRNHGLWHDEFNRCLDLDAKTRQHLQDLSDQKAYLSVRYPNDPVQRPCPINRMERTLEAIREKADRIPFNV
jgi:hypothetical protein